MTIPTITTTITAMPDPPLRGQGEDEFTEKSENWVSAVSGFVTEENSVISETNTTVTAINSAVDDINQDVTDAQTAATEAAASADMAAATANNNGAWSALTGSFPIGQAVNHNGSVWVSNVAIPDITASEPSEANSDWTLVTESGSTGWENAVTSSETLEANKLYNVFATSGAVDVTLPGPVLGDSLVISNDVSSNQTVRFIVSSSVQFTALNGTTYTATSNITISAGEKVYMACTKTAGTWEQK